jgi:hypothetical protein
MSYKNIDMHRYLKCFPQITFTYTHTHEHTHVHMNTHTYMQINTIHTHQPYTHTFSMVLGATKGLTTAQSVANTQGALIMNMFSITSG